MATISRLLKIIALFCRTLSLLQGDFAKKTYTLKESTNRYHPIRLLHAHIRTHVHECMWVYTYIHLCWMQKYIHVPLKPRIISYRWIHIHNTCIIYTHMHTRTQIHLSKYSRRSKYDLTVNTRATKDTNNRIQLNVCMYIYWIYVIHS